ncbi:hypothetical protein IWQ57_001756 [Coemansia nantahalensis]|uniref:Uncharacterized protein n=1 Tax=Coemansia nantahalensis TaxID=2789366 RepID=A0ACC1K320_9FUNG|nr:hypothetical protein IWQ57_001756 [Coemansia nantahalensis]
MYETRVSELHGKMYEIARAWEKTSQRGLVEACIDQLECIHERYARLRARLHDMRELRDALQEEYDGMHRAGIYGEHKMRPLDSDEQKGYEIVTSDLEEHIYMCSELEREVRMEVEMMAKVVAGIESQLVKNQRNARK